MQKKRSRLALTGMLALALSVTVGLLVGPAEAAKKKGKKGGTVSVSRTAPTAIPLETRPRAWTASPACR